jgi:hypothetical protein
LGWRGQRGYATAVSGTRVTDRTILDGKLLDLCKMGKNDCEQCRILLKEASTAISAQALAESLLDDFVDSEPPESLDRLKVVAHKISAACETAVERYENHRFAHELRDS